MPPLATVVATVVAPDVAAFAAAGTTLAHQGGWDEFLYVAAPIAVVAGLLKLAGTRARRIQAERDKPGSDGVTPEA